MLSPTNDSLSLPFSLSLSLSHPQDAYAASEILLVGGDHHIEPVGELDGRTIGCGGVGKVYERVVSLLREDMLSGSVLSPLE